MDIETKFLEVVGEAVGIAPEALSVDHTLEQHGLDNLDRDLLILTVEDAFDVHVNDANFATIKTLNDLYTLMVETLEQRARNA